MKNAAPPPIHLAPTAMFATSVSSQDGSCQLNCLIKGESIIFLVTAGCNCMVSDLKEDVQRKEAMGILKDIDPHTLELWKVSAIDESRCEVTWLTPTHQQVSIDLKNHDKHSLSHLKLESREGTKELAPWKSVEGYWSSQPSSTTCLHIVVKASDTGE
jgi:hypothetical protein